MSTQFFLQQGASTAGVAVIGLVADRFGLVGPFLCACALAFAVWLAVFRQREAMGAAFKTVRERTQR